MNGESNGVIKLLKRKAESLFVSRQQPSESIAQQRLTSRDALLEILPVGGVGVELGVAAGAFSQIILEKSGLSHLYSIDMWAGDRGHDLEQYKFVIKRLIPFRDRNTIIKARFDEALDVFPDAYFNFIYVDGYAHTGEEGGKTFQDWYPKLKPGGILAGDDYSTDWPLVVQAVDSFLAANNLTLNLTLAREMREEQGYDYPSWYVVKPMAG